MTDGDEGGSGVTGGDPFARFFAWFEQAAACEPSDHDAVALASVDADGRPTVRMVLMRACDERGFVFYTNTDSRKGREFSQNPYAALCFHWKSTARQVRIEGTVVPVSDAEADAYFASRPRESQVGAWASLQSTTLPSREVLEQRFAEYDERFAGASIMRPPHWHGYRLVASSIEFWDKRPYRLHERRLYTRENASWHHTLLYP